MNYASSISKNHLQKYCSNFVENQSSGCDDSLLSLDFCAKVLGKPCFNYKNAAKKNDKRLLVDIKKVVTVYTLIEETANPFVTERESKDSSSSKTATKPIAEESTNFCENPSMSTQFNESIFQEQVSESPISIPGDHAGIKTAILNNVLMNQDKTKMKDSQDNIGLATRKSQSICETRETQTNSIKKNEEILPERKKLPSNKRDMESRMIKSKTKDITTQTSERRHRQLPIDEPNHYTGYRHRPCYCNEESNTTRPSILMDSGSQGMDWYPVKDIALGVADNALQSAHNGTNKDHIDVITRGINTINTDSFNVQVTELVSSKIQTSNTGSIDAEICPAPIKNTCRCNGNMCHRRPSPQELSPKYIDNVPLKSEKYKQNDTYKETPRELCNCCCYCCCQPTHNDRHCSCEDCYLEPQYHGRPNHKFKMSKCIRQCRKCSCTNYTPPEKPPAVPTYDVSTSSDYDEDDDIELFVDRWDDTDSYSSENSVGHYRDLPHQTNEDYEDLVQELEESLQIRSRNRVQRALLEFEKKSRCNKPLEKPIINYEETSESEEPLIRKISELREKRKKMHKSFPCKGRACCTFRLNSDKEHNINEFPSSKFQENISPSVKNGKPVKFQSVQMSRKPRMTRTSWRQDKETGDWYKINPPLSSRQTKLPPHQRVGHFCSCNCSCGR